MSESQISPDAAEHASREERMSALFGQLVMQQANMAMLLLGKVAHPESGEVVKDVEAARLFIDELEMLEAKTQGNLTKDEAAFLKQSLMSLRLAFVEAVDSPASPASSGAPKPEAAAQKPAGDPTAAAAAEEEHRKKFSKKY